MNVRPLGPEPSALPTEPHPDYLKILSQAHLQFNFRKHKFCKYIFRANPNFKEVKVKGEELSSLPKGSVVVYDANEQCTDQNGQTKRIGKDGHVTVALGDGKACSDVMEDEIVKTDKAYVFIPV